MHVLEDVSLETDSSHLKIFRTVCSVTKIFKASAAKLFWRRNPQLIRYFEKVGWLFIRWLWWLSELWDHNCLKLNFTKKTEYVLARIWRRLQIVLKLFKHVKSNYRRFRFWKAEKLGRIWLTFCRSVISSMVRETCQCLNIKNFDGCPFSRQIKVMSFSRTALHCAWRSL